MSVGVEALVGLPAVLERDGEGYVARLVGAACIEGRGETGEDALEDLERAVMEALRREEAWFGGTIDEDDRRK